MGESFDYQYSKHVPLPFEKEETFSDGNFMSVHESFVDEGYVVKKTKKTFPVVEAREKIEAYKNEYRFLKEQLDDCVPNTTFMTVRSSDTKDAEYIKFTQERVFENSQQESGLLEQKRREIEHLMLKGLDIFESTYNQQTQKGVFLDMKTANVIFGHTALDPSDKLYFIDTSGSLREVILPYFIALFEARMIELDVHSIEIESRFEKIKLMQDA